VDQPLRDVRSTALPRLGAPWPRGPFSRKGLARRALPFAIVAGLALTSLALPPGPASTTDFLISLILLVAVVGEFFLPWNAIPSIATVAVPLTYTASVLFLILASGDASSGIEVVILIPVAWTALYHRRWESVVVVLGVVVVEVLSSLYPQAVSNSELFQRVLFWGLISALISYAAHDIRDRIQGAADQREELLRQSVLLEEAAKRLTTLVTTSEVIQAATRLAAEIASPDDTPGRRAQYTRNNDATVSLVAQFDESGQSIAQTFALSEHPNLTEVMTARQAILRPLHPNQAGPAVRQLIKQLDVTHAVYVPIVMNGQIDGILSTPIHQIDATPQTLEQCKAVGHLTELALTNAANHEMLLVQATTDSLTSLPNRRGFRQIVEHRPRRLPFAVLIIDVDGLKKVNDTQGHRAGDALLVLVAKTCQSALRRGDLVARMGGDEFATYLFNAEREDARQVAERMLDALAQSTTSAYAPSVSIGVAAGDPSSSAPDVFAAADAAMYAAKRKGGRRYELVEGTVAGGAMSDAPIFS
jgi:diguanylate cyclase (GGDEF)-like protein